MQCSLLVLKKHKNKNKLKHNLQSDDWHTRLYEAEFRSRAITKHAANITSNTYYVPHISNILTKITI